MTACQTHRYAPLIVAIFLLLVLRGTSVGDGSLDFARDIRPVLARACFQCHGPDSATRKADLRLDQRAGLLSVVRPRDGSNSELWLRIRHADPEERMPPLDQPQQLEAAEIDQIRQWIDSGAQWSEHWAFETPIRPTTPSTHDVDWPRNPVDRFVLAQLEAVGMKPRASASKEKLLRRLSFDLTGLPPTIEELDAFVADDSPDAYEHWVDRYLRSIHYGENMAVHWLDGARFADSNGYQNDFGRSMWPWRDWVIRSYNENTPYDKFLTEQIAGDLLPNATDEQRLATGFQRNHRTTTEGGSIEEEWRIENVVDRTDTTATVFMGLTYGCARCHDHKYDPISHADYYSLFAYFNNTTERGFYNETRGNVPTLIRVPTEENRLRLAEFDREIQKLEGLVQVADRQDLSAKLAAWIADLQKNTDEPPTPLWTLPLDRNFESKDDDPKITARYTGVTPVWEDGVFGGAIRIDAKASTRVDLGPATDFDDSDAFSYGIWVKRGNDGAIFSKMDVATNYRGIDLILIDGRPTVHLIHDWPQNAIKVEAEVELPSSIWTHLAFTYDGGGKAAGLHIYVNGKAAPRKTHADTLKGTIRTDEPLRIGGRSSREFYRGTVRDFRAYDRALTAKEAATLATSGLVRAASEPAHVELVEFHRAHVLEGPGSVHQRVKRARRERQQYSEREVPSAMVLQERRKRRSTYVLDRGLYDAPDPSRPVEPGVPSFLPALPADAPQDRLALAAWLIDPKHPLTSRVAVNHFWQQLFGLGLVETAENFGLRGALPSHPKLLDWLATEFVRTGWNTKALLKTIVMSATYRQSSVVTPQELERDPRNRLLGRGPRFRLSAEKIRDQALAVSGLLVGKVGGPSVKPYQPPGLWSELAGGASQGPYQQGKGSDLYRRSLYTHRKRTVPHPTLSVFDAPSFEICQVRRDRTNTPLQALALLNDTTYVEAARKLAERMMRQKPEVAARLTYGFRCATSRNPRSEELAVLERGFERQRLLYRGDPAGAREILTHGESPVDSQFDPVELAAFTAMAAVILNLDETVTKE